MSKVYPDAKAALDGLLHNNMTIAAGGFGLCGIPENLSAAVHDSGVKALPIFANSAGVDNFAMGILLPARQVKKVMAKLPTPALLPTMVRPFTPLSCSAAMRFSGIPHNPKPPAAIVMFSWRSPSSAAFASG